MTAETVTISDRPKGNFPEVPITRILALGSFVTAPTPDQVQAIFPQEVPATLKLYLEGKIEQLWMRHNQTGPVFLLNTTSTDQAHEWMESLPLGKEGLMRFEFIELSPLSPLHALLPKQK
jgi:hypothetical protein